MKVLTVIGNRPQFIKAAAVSPVLRTRADEVLVHTGQHFDDELSRVFFEELGIPVPEVQLQINGGSNSSQTARMLAALESIMRDQQPDCVLVYGDTNSTLAGALAAVQQGLPVAHVEAGMRSFDRAMPEEVNRVVTDHLSTLLLCPSEVAVANLAAEGIGDAVDADCLSPAEGLGGSLDAGALSPPEGLIPAGDGVDQVDAVGASVEVVGDVMVDVAMAVQPRAREYGELLAAYGLEPRSFVLATAHRAGNVDDPVRLSMLVELLLDLKVPVVLPLHPRTRARLEQHGLLGRLAGGGDVLVVAPLGYVQLTSLLVNARAVLTDSGGMQKEAYLAAVKCITMRPSTEWVETVETGWNTLVDLDPLRARRALAASPPADHPQLYGDGKAGERVVQALLARFGP